MDFYLFDEPPPEYDDGLDELDDFDLDSDLVDSHYPLFYSTAPFIAPPRSTFLRKAPTTLSVSNKMAATAAAAVSPLSSPRLPSPPPFTEVQIGPQSPTVGDKGGDSQLFTPLIETDDGSTRRIRPGTKAADMASGPPLVPLSQLDSPFQLQEHLKALFHNYTMPNGSSTIHPITHEVAVSLAHPPEGVERSLWLYELCRFLTMKVNNLIIAFFAEDPPCSQQSCPEMRASEWQYLCAVHDPPKSCCAIDYCCHTLDWATNILTSPKYFPSRLTLGSESGGGPQASMRHLTNIFRRLYRIFAHAWFQHRDVFRQVENTDGLYVFFKTVCDVYELIPQDNYTVPEEAERLAASDDAAEESQGRSITAVVLPPENNRRISVLRNDSSSTTQALSLEHSGDAQASLNISTGATTRRHKHSPSTGSSVSTIAEVTEDHNSPSPKVEQTLPKVEENAEDAKSNVPAEDAEKDPSTAQSEAPENNKISEKEEKASEAETTPEEAAPTQEEAQTTEAAEPEAGKQEESETNESPSTATDAAPEDQPPTSEREPSSGKLETDFKFPITTNEEKSTTESSDFPTSTESTATVSVVETTEEKDE
ncbi:Mob1 family protein [Talaromyces stipitatus ATCC 10500]|uniref:Mob1 family protein n=1 Tax=Talaromyces stipitatus (strain ATCC 10500 / CBS 375.48 / QM 6759 / NRRL 1006) TaxID=441959 RepID=B8M3Z8_TALSN|nr:Mob1 family protein [Talaromyces stipitatus ATCC 10500]EED20741.1 Mob1 family protein [Talaromyces stipitatus ATCC 10500]